MVATLNAARVLGSIAAVLDVDHTEFARLALEAEPGAGGVVLVPYFEGERTPNLPDATASLTGLTIASSTRPNFARAAIEGMLCGLAAGLDAVRAVGVTDRLLFIGSPSDDHHKYLGDGTESLANIKLIIQGNGDQITAGRRPTLLNGTPNFGAHTDVFPPSDDFTETFKNLNNGTPLPQGAPAMMPPVNPANGK